MVSEYQGRTDAYPQYEKWEHGKGSHLIGRGLVVQALCRWVTGDQAGL